MEDILKQIKKRVAPSILKKITEEGGYVAQDRSGQWFWYATRPAKEEKIQAWRPTKSWKTLFLFSGMPPKSWKRQCYKIQPTA